MAPVNHLSTVSRSYGKSRYVQSRWSCPIGVLAVSNSGRAVKLSVNILAGCRVLSAVDT
jgi:hypothetical protein